MIQHIGVHMQVSWYLAWHVTLIIREPKTRKKCVENSNIEKNKNMLSHNMGLEPMTLRLKVWCSTDCANRAATIFTSHSWKQGKERPNALILSKK